MRDVKFVAALAVEPAEGTELKCCLPVYLMLTLLVVKPAIPPDLNHADSRSGSVTFIC
jgi:hypothetical protein